MTTEATPQSHNGPSPGPRGEKLADTPATEPGKKARRRSPTARKRIDHHDAGNGVAEIGGSLESSITRATGKIWIEPMMLAADYDAHRASPRRCGGPEKCGACRFFAVVNIAQREAARAANVLLRKLWLDDAGRLEILPRPFKTADWPAPTLNGYAIVRQHAPSLSGGVASAVAKVVTDKWRQTRWDALVKMSKSPPHWHTTMPLPIRAQELGGVERRGEGIYSLRFSISPALPERKGKEFTVPIRARDGYQHELLEMLSDDASRVKIGAAHLQQHKIKREKWMLTLTYTRIVPANTGTVSVAINRGMRCFLASATSAGDRWLYDGHDIEAHLRRIQARRREIQRDIVGSNRVGHGRQRALLAIQRLEAAGERWRTTKCQVVARRFVDWVVSLGYGRVTAAQIGTLYVEDFSGIRNEDWDKLDGGKAVWNRIQEWPYFQLVQRIKSCAEEHGIKVVEVAPQYISRRCPRCGHVDRERQGGAPRHLKCSQCRFVRHIDIVAAMNLLARASGKWTEDGPLENVPGNGRRARRSSGSRRNG